jgi:hypothetical protein
MRKLVVVCALLAASLPGFVVLAQVPRTAIDTAEAATVFIETNRGSGSGFLFSADGYILTCNHVVDGATTIQVYIPGGRQLPGRLVQAAPEIDAAVLKIDATVQTYLSLGDSATASYGDEVAAIGYPARVFTVTTGTVSAFPTLGQTQIMQVTAAINPGNSGGPLIRYSGEVIGVIFAAADADEYLRQYGFVPQAMNYAIPINLVKERFGLAGADWRLTLTSTLVFQDDFTQPADWSIGSGDEGYIACYSPDGSLPARSLHMIDAIVNTVYWIALPVQAPDNFVLEFDVRSVSASPSRWEEYGVVFRWDTAGKGSYYLWSVRTDGVFLAVLNRDGSKTDLVSGTASPAISRDRATNHLRLIAQGGGFRLEINGVQVAHLQDAALARGRVGLLVGTAAAEFSYSHIAFDNVRLYRLP